MFTHDSVDLLGRMYAKCRNNHLHADASAAHATELQIQVAALEAKIVNPTKETSIDMVLKDSDSGDNRPQDASQGSPKRWSNNPGNDQGPVATSVTTEGLAQNNFRLI